MKKIIIILIVILLVCSHTAISQVYDNSLDLSADNIIRLDELAEETRIYVSAEEVTFIFRIKPYDSKNNKFHAYRLTAYADSSIFKYVKHNTDENEIPFFAPGTGMAAARSGRYEELIINNKANYYLVYDKDSADRQRMDLIGQEDDHLLVKISFTKLLHNGRQADFTSLSGVTLYLIAYYDKNLNDIAEKGEYKKIILIFK